MTDENKETRIKAIELAIGIFAASPNSFTKVSSPGYPKMIIDMAKQLEEYIND